MARFMNAIRGGFTGIVDEGSSGVVAAGSELTNLAQEVKNRLSRIRRSVMTRSFMSVMLMPILKRKPEVLWLVKPSKRKLGSPDYDQLSGCGPVPGTEVPATVIKAMLWSDAVTDGESRRNNYPVYT